MIRERTPARILPKAGNWCQPLAVENAVAVRLSAARFGFPDFNTGNQGCALLDKITAGLGWSAGRVELGYFVLSSGFPSLKRDAHDGSLARGLAPNVAQFDQLFDSLIVGRESVDRQVLGDPVLKHLPGLLCLSSWPFW